MRPLQTGFAQNWLECTGELVTDPDFYPELVPVGTVALQTVMSSPETGASSARVMYSLAIAAARESIEIANPYFVPGHLVDGSWATVGTTNFDNRSFAHNEESNVCLCDKAVARELNEMFEEDAAACERVGPVGQAGLAWLASRSSRGILANVSEGWCGREDSNLHPIARTSS